MRGPVGGAGRSSLRLFHAEEYDAPRVETRQRYPGVQKKAKSDPANYRPVSLLSVFSKVMESVINQQLVNFLECNSVFSANQFGFRARLGTQDLLAALHHEWIQSVNKGGCNVLRCLGAARIGKFLRSLSVLRSFPR